MKPRGPLMIEHRLIEKMLGLAAREVDRIKNEGKADPVYVDTLVDFIRVYADRTHHGKEEDILFRELEAKSMESADRERMRELVEDHVTARKAVRDLVEGNRRYRAGDETGLAVIVEKLSFLIGFYPEHIRKEDKVFFPDTERYFTTEELDHMLKEFWEFDRRMIHEKYEKLCKSLEEGYQ